MASGRCFEDIVPRKGRCARSREPAHAGLGLVTPDEPLMSPATCERCCAPLPRIAFFGGARRDGGGRSDADIHAERIDPWFLAKLRAADRAEKPPGWLRTDRWSSSRAAELLALKQTEALDRQIAWGHQLALRIRRQGPRGETPCSTDGWTPAPADVRNPAPRITTPPIERPLGTADGVGQESSSCRARRSEQEERRKGF